VTLRLFDDEGEEVFLREHHDVWEARPEAAEVCEDGRAFVGHDGARVDFGVRQLM
jgi:hypothetical protein